MIGDYTVEVWKKDGRYKAGWKLVSKKDYVEFTKENLLYLHKTRHDNSKFEFRIYDTFVTKKNLLTGEPFKERYDTPYYCSPSSETYWSS
jgi:hypothetical protein